MPATYLGTALQIRLKAILDADAALGLLLGDGNRVYDHVPDKQRYPFIVIGEEDVEAFRSKTSKGHQGITTIYVMTQSQDKAGQKQCKDIMSRVWALLDNVDLQVPDRVQVSFFCEGSNILVEDDNQTYQGMMRFNFIFGGDEQ